MILALTLILTTAFALEEAVGKYYGDPALKNEPLERKRSIEGMWSKSTGEYYLQRVPNSAVTDQCKGQGTWIKTDLRGWVNFDWTREQGVARCDGIHPVMYKKDMKSEQVMLCCPDYPYTKNAKKCDRTDKNFGCNKNAKKRKGDGICDLEDCGNCPAMWDKNVFDKGDCGKVAYKAVCECSGHKNSNGRGGPNCSGAGNNGKPWCYVSKNSGCTDKKGSGVPWSENACKSAAESLAVVNSGSFSTFETITYIFAAAGLSVVLYGSFRYYSEKN